MYTESDRYARILTENLQHALAISRAREVLQTELTVSEIRHALWKRISPPPGTRVDFYYFRSYIAGRFVTACTRYPVDLAETVLEEGYVVHLNDQHSVVARPTDEEVAHDVRAHLDLDSLSRAITDAIAGQEITEDYRIAIEKTCWHWRGSDGNGNFRLQAFVSPARERRATIRLVLHPFITPINTYRIKRLRAYRGPWRRLTALFS